MTDHTEIPDYQIAEVLELTTPEQFKAIGDTTRSQILSLVGEQAATTKQIAEALRLPKGTAGHHLKVLEAAGLIHVVRTRQVRAITEKYYGRVARLFRVSSDSCVPGVNVASIPDEVTTMPLRQALAEYSSSHLDDDPSTFIITHARVPASRAREFAHMVEALAKEFDEHTDPSERVYGFVAGVYLTARRDLPSEET